MQARHVHVIAERNVGWKIQTEGSSPSSEVFEDRDEAIKVAGEQARREGVDLYVHGPDGRIRDHRSYAPLHRPFRS
ncbi:DUF2188 domain-containing protein [Cupriavidus malaysiensis]|uniref:DUF2188 domain-containing protein n=1 Tax=Cupriavidus malaysiensis TaxID=367825 RepID=A0ABM6FF95_9BURK|nr:DUF2188 domain-containing protein [Cupriavidus malaysiensis]AOZ10590.1 hypothetical protein BKK80_34180 [Cupriavidus malaysiensis]